MELNPRMAARETRDQWCERTQTDERHLFQAWKQTEREGRPFDEQMTAYQACSDYKNQVAELAKSYLGLSSVAGLGVKATPWIRRGKFSARVEWKVADLWVGVFFRREVPTRFLHLWVCILPMVPVHLMVDEVG